MKREMEAYIVLLHLVSQGRANFTDIRDLLGWEIFKQSEAQRIVAHINHKLPKLSEAWGEDIPQINAFVFRRDGRCTSYIREKVFGCEEGEHPSAQQIAEYAKRITDYPKLGQGFGSVSGGSFFKG